MYQSRTADPSAPTAYYSTREVAKLLGIPPRRVQYMVRSGFLTPERGPRGEFRFSFQDLVLLRSARELLDAGFPAQKIRISLERLSRQLPDHRPLTAVRIRAEGAEILAQVGRETWHPQSGQMHLDFEAAEASGPVRELHQAREEALWAHRAEILYEEGCDLEVDDPAAARQAYQEAVELNPNHADALLNLGRLLHEERRLAEAESSYRRVLVLEPGSAVATFNLGVVLEDLGRSDEAVKAYQRAVELDEGLKEAHFNLARLYERLGSSGLALQHLRIYRRLAGE